MTRLGKRFAGQAGAVLRLGPAFLALVFGIRLFTLAAYPLIDPTESRYAEMARKMLETGNWVSPQIDYGVWFWGKPPLAVWLNAASLGVFGVNEFAARLSALLLFIGIVWLVWRLAVARAGGSPFAAPAILMGMALAFVMAGSVAMDQCLTLGTTLAMASFWLALREGKPVYGYGFFLGLGIGLLSKGPVALVLTGLPIGLWVLLRNEWARVWERLPWIKGTLLMLAISVPWYLIAERRTPGFLEYFFIGEHWKRFTEPGWQGDLYGSGRGHPRGTIWLYWLLAALPWSPVFLTVVAVSAWRKQAAGLLASADGWRWYCLFWMLSPLVFFTVSANVIWTYVLPGLPGGALLLAEWLGEGRMGWLARDKLLAAIGGLVPVLFLGAVITAQFVPLAIVRSQKALVARYQELRQGADDKLYYLRENPFSAQFYTRGKSREVGNVEVFQNMLEHPGREFFAFPRRYWSDLPEVIKSRLQAVGAYSDFVLLRRMPQAGEQ